MPDTIRHTLKELMPAACVIGDASAADGVDPRIVAYAQKTCPLAEQYRMLQADLCALAEVKKIRTIAVTSSQKGEGKTLVCCNLALTLAADPAKKVLLIDADLRKPDIHTMLGLPKEPGLSDAVTGTAPIADLAHKPALGNLYVITAGTTAANAADILRKQKLKEGIESLKARFDYILFDTPPILPVSDARILAALCDGVLLTVKADGTPRSAVEEAMKMLDNAHMKPMAFVLTNFQLPFYELTKRKYRYEGYGA